MTGDDDGNYNYYNDKACLISIHIIWNVNTESEMRNIPALYIFPGQSTWLALCSRNRMHAWMFTAFMHYFVFITIMPNLLLGLWGRP